MIFAVLDVSLAVNLCINLHFLVERPALAATRLMVSICLFFFITAKTARKSVKGRPRSFGVFIRNSHFFRYFSTIVNFEAL